MIGRAAARERDPRGPALIRVLCLLVIVAWSSLPGCAATGRTAGDVDVMHGVSVDMYVVDEDLSFARYRVETDGILSFGGGVDAQQERYTWSGPLTADERDRLVALIEAKGWFEADPPSTGRPAERRYTITIRRPGERRSFKAIGDCPAIAPVHELLATASRRRNEAFLDSLPKPGMQR